jgi:diguanylate cyclase (GGDEF)-like protein
LGGDEFVVLLPFGTGETEGRMVAERILKTLAQPILIGENTLKHTGSIGIMLASAGMSVLDVLGGADVALYEAKARGRNQAVLSDQGQGGPSTTRAVARAD